MPPAPDRGGGPAPRPAREQARLAIAAVALLCAAWTAAAVLVIGVLASVDSRARVLRILDGLIPGPAGPPAASPGVATGMALCALLLAAGALLVHTAPELLRGSRTARLAVWAGTPLLAAEPVRRAAAALGDGGADVTVAVCTLVIAATALLAAALLAAPSAGFRPARDVTSGRRERASADRPGVAAPGRRSAVGEPPDGP